MDLDGVEYKSLPSGLHAVKEDLVYFIHDKYAGISIFVRGEADEQHRNASFVAVGALVPLSYGQLGRSWVHAEELRSLARDIVKDPHDTRALELFWRKHKSEAANRKGSASPDAKRGLGEASTSSKKRKRAVSEATLAGINIETVWPKDHPASQVPALLDTFGPLLFPLHRAALARKRVLLLGNPAVQEHANVVYMTSVLSSIPRALEESLPTETEPYFRSQALFSIGIHDIPSLSDRDGSAGGWLACTTDDILGEKKDLYDVVVRLPDSGLSARGGWPTLHTASGRVLKASQRDLRRWTLLRRELKRLRGQVVGTYRDERSSLHAESDRRPLLRRSLSSNAQDDDTGFQDDGEWQTVEASSWTAMAYRGFMWWASAGDASAWENDEVRADEELLFDMPDTSGLFPKSDDGSTRESEYARAAATLVVAYFRRVTEETLRTMANMVEEADDDTEEGIQEDEIAVSGDDMRTMGLDSWSEEGKVFVQDMLRFWFDREAKVMDRGVTLCGVKVC